MHPTHTGSTLLSYSKDKSIVELVELLFTCNQLNRFCEPPACAYNLDPKGVDTGKFDDDGHIVGHMVELWEAKWSPYELICIYDT